ncbi:hypothetical protein PR048_010677 [Dryococelus australis]|uniref:Uncharacterized protein n=1 Tax=Dryococelus australis TaxID=614101 RepID=A0ABQ9I3E6_9NEOP|nr:hypothetical protein PR048_010677 [Dryococelus australis]
MVKWSLSGKRKVQRYGHLTCSVQGHDGNTARLAHRSDEALAVRVTVARIARSLLDFAAQLHHTLNIELLRAGAGEGGGEREIPEETRRPAASSDTIPTCENPRADGAERFPSFPHQLPAKLNSHRNFGHNARKTEESELNVTTNAPIFSGNNAAIYKQPCDLKVTAFVNLFDPARLAHVHPCCAGITSERGATDTAHLRTSQGRLRLSYAPAICGREVQLGASAVVLTEPMRVIVVSMEQRRNAREGEKGDPRENPPTSGIVRHDSHLRKSGVTRPEIEPGSPWWEASSLTGQRPRSKSFSATRHANSGMTSQTISSRADQIVYLKHAIAHRQHVANAQLRRL